MKVESAQSSPHREEFRPDAVKPPENLGDAESGNLFVIDSKDPHSPQQTVLDKMSASEKSWIGMLLKPFDMLYHLCNGAKESLNATYQQQITATLTQVDSAFESSRKELEKQLGESDFLKLEQLCAQRVNICNEAVAKSTLSETDQIVVKVIDEQINQLLSQHPLTSTCKALLHVLQQGCCLRTPLLMLQVAFTTPIPELPGGYAKTGLQMQLVIPTMEVFKSIFRGHSIESLYLQPFIHLEGGISASIDLNKFVSVPVGLKASTTGMRVSHFGLNIKLDKWKDEWHCGQCDYIIETVNRLEGNVEVNKALNTVVPGIQLKVGGDTVRQFVFPGNVSGSLRFITQFALRAIGAVGFGSLALGHGLSLSTAKAAGLAGQDMTGMIIEMSGLIQPDKVIDIVELFTLGIDLSMTTALELPYLGTLDAMSMHRFNGNYLVEHPRSQLSPRSAAIKTESVTEQQVRKRKISPNNQSL